MKAKTEHKGGSVSGLNQNSFPGLSNVPESTERCRFEIHGCAGSLDRFSSRRSACVVSVPPQGGGVYQPRVATLGG